MSNPLHLKKSSEWFTPPAYIEAARSTMRGIDLDPASCAEANEAVKATKWFGKEENGLLQPWFGTVFINPPGGLVKEFWCKLVEEWKAGRVTQAIWVGYSLQQLQTLQRFETTPLDFQLCFPKKRISFIKLDELSKTSPTHANYICNVSKHGQVEFDKHFRQFGKVVVCEY